MARTSHLMKAIRKPKFRVRRHNRCPLCGRPRGFFRRFRMCRICLRNLALKGQIPGLIKASW
ncbi:MAG TPA: type Z 30S ribosomal protein S14 [Candidatus Binatia bacterium]|nr:type Z 30S ribosomal protein S14 [Candidatus Binatia bacterium]